ncbi:dethiobiotin synthase [Billgrantia kenyensis]|uniref:ATP-dependent dethiobiotin synthetase BioD n=1 Tax=Billgrantia kenyensis TaxID=321266 RepID=A0A7V9W0F1_9GAMM|nr:dethiobiotin synthase [Halomonas kenyensis]MBA2778754.1 dethiobiotin synthase [Halomonas kenyensis]MCG6661816.1 dethiobiotin synthase [Halomonas kenyensis]
MTAYFVTGTDTDAGKTLVSAGMLALARSRGMSTLGLKPVASGCLMSDEGLRNDDALALQARSLPQVAYHQVNPFAFEPAIAPHLAARQAGAELNLARLCEQVEPLLREPRDLTLVEGAGGWRVPLNDREDLAGLALQLELPVILVVGLKLGCLNHARLTAEAIRADGARLAGWAGSVVDAAFTRDTALFNDNLATLERTLGAPCLGVVPRLRRVTASRRPEAALAYLELPCFETPHGN